MKHYTDITVLLDRSGSMNSIKESMEQAYNTFLEEHKKTPSTKITLVQFDDIAPYDVVYQVVPVKYAEKLTLRPRGNTPLIDAFCKVIDRTGERLAAMNEADRPDQVMLVVITDGQENASKEFKRSDVFNRVTKQRNDYKWEFVYLGANQDSFAEAQSYGIPWGNTIKWTPDHKHTLDSVSFLSAHTHAYVDNTMRGTTMTAFTEDERSKAATKADRDQDSVTVTTSTT